MNDALATDDGLSVFLGVRPRLLSIAGRMVRGAVEAEDVVQETWVRWQAVDRSVVRDAEAFLVATTVRLSINILGSARARREVDAKPGAPEPIDPRVDPRARAERGPALEVGIRLLLERLTPTERAAFILREAFAHSYREIANLLRIEEANARQVVSRARRHIAVQRNAPANPTERRRLHEAFAAAAGSGELSGLQGLLVLACGSLAA